MKSRKVVVSVTAVFVAAILLAVIFTQACGTGTVDESEKAPEVELQFAMCYEMCIRDRGMPWRTLCQS